MSEYTKVTSIDEAIPLAKEGKLYWTVQGKVFEISLTDLLYNKINNILALIKEEKLLTKLS